ncbi:unnamed protein product [Paramecium octaurelia]|uniref:Uncharacterized protein n=1 Tax=Paramecium octaurelia TaxID=43137 RepID=A0A8S1UP34_PAROT|nr:unnamed protein product [Paramecium octaurelia]
MDQLLLNLIVNQVDIQQTNINYQNLEIQGAKQLFQYLQSKETLKHISNFGDDEQCL